MELCQAQEKKASKPGQLSEKSEIRNGIVRVVIDKSDKRLVVNVRADYVQVGDCNIATVAEPDISMVGECNRDVVADSASVIARPEYTRPVLRFTRTPDLPIRVGRITQIGFPDQNDHVFTVTAFKNGCPGSRERLEVDFNNSNKHGKKYTINASVAVCEPGGKERDANFQVRQLKSDTRGEASFVFRFHDRPARLSVKFTLEVSPVKRSSKKKREVIDEVASKVITVKERSKLRKQRDSGKDGDSRDSGSEVMKACVIFNMAPANNSKESIKLNNISDQIRKTLHRARDNGRWELFDELADKLSVMFPDPDSQVVIQLERSEAVCYHGDLESSCEMLQEILQTLKKSPSIVNATVLVGSAYHKLAGVYRRQRKLGAALDCVELGEQHLHTVGVTLDKSFLVYERATIMLEFMAELAERSPVQILKAKEYLEKCIDMRGKLRTEDDGKRYVKDLQFIFIKIALLLLDCRTTAGRQRRVPDEYVEEAKARLDTLEERYWGDMTQGARVQFCIVRSDQFYRLKNYIRAAEFAEEALNLAQEKGFGTETELVRERLGAIQIQRQLATCDELPRGEKGQLEVSRSSDTEITFSSSSNSSFESQAESVSKEK